MITPSYFTTVVDGYLPEPHASLLNGIIFGQKLETSKLFYMQLKRVGLLHIVVLSGMNITMLCAFLAVLFERFGRTISSLISIASILLFIYFVGPQAPVVRAGCMGILTVVAVLFGRKAMSLYLLFLSGGVIVLFWPQWITTVSFQLSFAATLGLILFSPRANRQNLANMTGVRKFLYPLEKEWWISIAAQVFTVPIIFIYFRQVSLISPVANVLVAPIVAPVMLFGFATALLGKIHYILGYPFSLICYGLLSYLVLVVQWLEKVPYGFIAF